MQFLNSYKGKKNVKAPAWFKLVTCILECFIVKMMSYGSGLTTEFIPYTRFIANFKNIVYRHDFHMNGLKYLHCCSYIEVVLFYYNYCFCTKITTILHHVWKFAVYSRHVSDKIWDIPCEICGQIGRQIQALN